MLVCVEVFIYVVLAGKSDQRMTEIKKPLAERFEMKDHGMLHHFLRDRNFEWKIQNQSVHQRVLMQSLPRSWRTAWTKECIKKILTILIVYQDKARHCICVLNPLDGYLQSTLLQELL